MVEIRNKNELSADVVVIGAGVAGLMLSRKLANIGVTVALIEKNGVLAGSSSIRNEGWLHRGTYHAASIKDRPNALQVARRCAYGFDQISRYAPESIEDIDFPSFALLKNGDSVAEIVSRWEEAEIPHKPIRISDFEKFVPEANTSMVSNVFRVKDLGINTRILYKKLFHDCERLGVHVIKGADIDFHRQNEVQVNSSGELTTIITKVIAFTTGYETGKLISSNFEIKIPVRTWKSHLVVTRRLAKHNVFYLDPGEAAMVNHGDYSIVGLNEDAYQCEDTNTECVDEKVADVVDAIQRLFFLATDVAYFPVACIKTDLRATSGLARSLNIAICEPLPNYFCALPGKMTETPYLTDVLVRLIYGRLLESHIAERPLDSWMHNQSETLVSKDKLKRVITPREENSNES